MDEKDSTSSLKSDISHLLSVVSSIVSSFDAFKVGIGQRMEKSEDRTTTIEKSILVLQTYLRVLTWIGGLVMVASVSAVVAAFWRVILK